MKVLLLVLALIGSALSLCPGKQYVYQYEGRLGIGIPEIRNRVAGAGIQTTVVIQVQSEDRILFKLQDIKVGEYAGDVGCELRNPIPIHYGPLSGQGRVLEEPFSVNLKKSKGEVMIVPKADREWMTNIRKSVATLFLIEPIRANLGAVEDKHSAAKAFQNNRDVPHSFSVKEPSIFGYCYSYYTITPAEQIPARHSGSGQQSRNETLIRSINFSQCSDQVILQHTSVGNTSIAAENQSGDIASRSSVMTVRLLNETGKYTIQNGTVEGTLVLNPFGISQDKLISISNQTYHLKSVEKIPSPFPAPSPSKAVSSWYMEVASPYSPAEGSPSWVNFYNSSSARYDPILTESVATGIPIKKEDIEKYKSILERLLDETAAMMLRVGPAPPPREVSPFMTDEAKIVTKLESSYSVVRGLDVPTLEHIFESYYSDQSEKGQMKLKLLIDVCSASGTGAPFKVLLNQMQKQKITPERIASIFFTLPNNLLATPAIPDITAFVKTLSLERNPLVTSIVWINYASTLSKLCLSKEKWQYTVPYPIFGSQECQPKDVVDSILPFFQDQLNKATEPWQQEIIVHAIGNLGTVEAVSTLSNIIHGSYVPQVRVVAIYALINSKLPPEMRGHIFNTLMPLVADSQEDSYLRQAAVATLLSWQPSPSWYQKMAVSTWREPSNDMASFSYLLLQSIAQSTDPAYKREAQVAQFVLPLAKPYSPSSRYSYALFWSKFIQRDYLAMDVSVAVMRNEFSKYAREVSGALMNSFGGLRFSVFQAAYASELNPASLAKIFEEVSGVLPHEWRSVVRAATNRRNQEAFSELKNLLSPPPSQGGNSSFIFLSMFDSLEIFAPISRGSLSKLFGNDISHILKSLSTEKEVHLTKFFNFAPIEVFLPSEMGISVLAKISVPTVNGGEGKSRLRVDGKECSSLSELIHASNITLNITTNYKFATKTLTTIRALLPWSEKLIAAGVDTMKSLTLPMAMQVEVQKGSPHKNTSLHIIPTQHSAFTAAHVHTYPFIVIKSMWPGDDPKQFEKFQPISIRGSNEGVIQRRALVNKAYTGIEGVLRYEGDVPYPFTYGNLLSYIGHPEQLSKLLMSPTARMFSSCFIVNFGASPTQELHLSIAGFSNTTGDVPPINETQYTFRLYNGSYEYGMSGHLLLNGSESRYFEASITEEPLVRTNTNTTSRYTLIAGRTPIPSYDPSPSVYCVSMNASSPAISSIESLRQVLSSSVQTYVAGEVLGGTSCHDQQIARVYANLTVSEERRHRLSEELQSVCNYDPADPMVAFRTSPVYDTGSLVIDYKEPVPKTLKNITYQVYDVIRGIAFPHIYFDYMDVSNPSGKIAVVGNRSLGEERWELAARLPTENVTFDHFRVPPCIEQIVPYGGISEQQFSTPAVIFDSQISNKCTLSKSQVRSFDGYSYSYTPKYCPSYVIVNREDHDAPVFYTAIDYRTKNFIATVGSSGTGLTIRFDSRKVLVDGKELPLSSRKTVINNTNGAYFAEASKSGNSVEINVPGNFSLRLSDSEIVVTPSRQMIGKYGGLCGNYMESSQRGMVGPKYCKYNDHKLYVASWTFYSSEGCDYHEYLAEHNKVTDFQKHCPKVKGAEPTHQLSARPPPSSEIPHDCLEFVYIVKKRGEMLCVSQDVIAICYPICKMIHEMKYQEVYDCWPEPYAPKELARSLQRGYIKHKIHRRPEVTTPFKTDHAFICSRR